MDSNLTKKEEETIPNPSEVANLLTRNLKLPVLKNWLEEFLVEVNEMANNLYVESQDRMKREEEKFANDHSAYQRIKYYDPRLEDNVHGIKTVARQ